MNTFTFNKMFNAQTGKTMVATDEKSINDCLAMLISTCRGELLGDPNFGTDIKKYLMNYKGEPLFQLIREDIVRAIKSYEKRALVKETSIKLNQLKDQPNSIYITIRYKDLTSGTNKELELSVNRGAM